MIKIAVILPHLQNYGGVRRFLELGNEFVLRGYDYTIYSLAGEKQCNWFDYYGKIEILNYEYNQNDILIIGDTNYFSHFHGFHGLKIMYVVSTSDACNYINTYISYLKSNIIDLAVFCSSTAWEFYSKFVKLDQNKHFLIPGGINLQTFRPIENLCPQEPTILFYSCADMPRKGHDIIFNKIKDLGYKMITFSRLPINIQHLNLQQFNDVENNFLPKIYNRASLFIHHERGAGWANTAAEAMACGLPIITNGNGSTDFCIPGKTAIVTDDIEQGIDFYKKHSCQQMISNGREKLKEFTWKKVADKLEIIIKERI